MILLITRNVIDKRIILKKNTITISPGNNDETQTPLGIEPLSAGNACAGGLG
jgi:hypothetical protein